MKQYGADKVHAEPGKPQGFEETGSVSRDIPGIGFTAHSLDWPNHTYEMEPTISSRSATRASPCEAQAMAALLFDFATRRRATAPR